MTKIELGQEVRCKITGFKGIAVARSVFINGCVQYNVAPKHQKGKHPVDQEVSIDATSLELVKKPRKKIEKRDTGGASKHSTKMRGY